MNYLDTLPAPLRAVHDKFAPKLTPIANGSAPSPGAEKTYFDYYLEWQSANKKLKKKFSPWFTFRNGSLQSQDDRERMHPAAPDGQSWDACLKARRTHDVSGSAKAISAAAIFGRRARSRKTHDAQVDHKQKAFIDPRWNAAKAEGIFEVGDVYGFGNGAPGVRAWRGWGSWVEPTEKHPNGRMWPNTIRNSHPAEFSEVMGTLTSRQRKVYRLYFEENYIIREIAKQIRRSGGAVSEMISRIRERFLKAGLPDPRHLCDGRKGSSSQSTHAARGAQAW